MVALDREQKLYNIAARGTGTMAAAVAWIAVMIGLIKQSSWYTRINNENRLKCIIFGGGLIIIKPVLLLHSWNWYPIKELIKRYCYLSELPCAVGDHYDRSYLANGHGGPYWILWIGIQTFSGLAREFCLSLAVSVHLSETVCSFVLKVSAVYRTTEP